MTTSFDYHNASWDEHPPATNYESLEEKAEQVSQLFSSTITALASDVYALRHLTSWKDIIEENSENGEDHHERREEFLESLCDLDDVVSAVEKKVGVLRQIVSEEQRALNDLNLLHKDSIDQNEHLQQLVERCRNIRGVNKQPAPQNKPKSRTTARGGATNRAVRAKVQRTPKPVREPFSSASVSSSDSHDQHTHIEGLSCHFDPVSVEELESVPRTTRGRVQVCVINEALDNIGKCFHKNAVKERKRQLLLEESRRAALNRYQGLPVEFDDEELLQNLVVTEQELRQSCAFFLAGEGTARTVLAVLKALRRIKQVPQKQKGLFMYKLCLD